MTSPIWKESVLFLFILSLKEFISMLLVPSMDSGNSGSGSTGWFKGVRWHSRLFCWTEELAGKCCAESRLTLLLARVRETNWLVSTAGVVVATLVSGSCNSENRGDSDWLSVGLTGLSLVQRLTLGCATPTDVGMQILGRLHLNFWSVSQKFSSKQPGPESWKVSLTWLSWLLC